LPFGASASGGGSKRSCAGSAVTTPTDPCRNTSRAGGLFPPDDPECRATLEILRRSPEQFGHTRSAWTVDLIRRTALPGLASYSGVYKRLGRWKISRKEARLHINSPDPFYVEKLLVVEHVFRNALEEPDKHVLVFADEATFYRQPTLTRCYSARAERPLAVWNGAANTKFRICAGLDAVTGAVVPTFRSSYNIPGLNKWLRTLRGRYGPDVRICVAWDNWPVHAHAGVVETAESLGIQLLSLPTYAPWTNPIEKVWRLLRQNVCHMHAYQLKKDWPAFKEKIKAFLAQYQEPSVYILRYVGLERRKCTL
jgi:hypothetical protein